MKQVWKCDHCSDTDGDKEKVEIHEAKCEFNPITKRCFTCKHSIEKGAPISGFWSDCKLKLDIESDDKCSGWENEN